jgi:hypothetical protein
MPLDVARMWHDLGMGKKSKGAGSFWDDENPEPEINENPEPEIKKVPRFGVLGIWDAKTPKEKKEARIIMVVMTFAVPVFLPVLLGIILYAQYKEKLKEL